MASNLTSGHLKGTLEALHMLPGVEVPSAFEGLDQRLVTGTPGVALIGLFNRGKSTLFNMLLGQPVSPISWEAETSAFITAQTGLEEAFASRAGTAHQLPCEPAAFAEAITRGAADKWDYAHIRGRFRIPKCRRLIDTPGLNEPGAAQSDDWMRNAIQGALVVVSWPPGAAEQDLKLLSAAHSALAGNVAVAVTRTTPSGGDTELEKIATKVRDETGATVVVVPATGPENGWRQDSAWLDVEVQLDELFERAAATQAELWKSFSVFVTETTQRLRSVQWTELELPILASALAIDGVAPVLKSAIAAARIGGEARVRAAQQSAIETARRHAEATAAAKERDRRADRAIAKARVAVAEAQAWQPAGLWDRVDAFLDGGAKPLYAGAGSAWREVANLARTGAPAAIAEVQALLRDSMLLDRMSLSSVELVLALPAGQAQDRGYQNAALGPEERAELHRRLPHGSLKSRVERELLSSLGSDNLALAEQLRTSRDPYVRRRALEVLATPIIEAMEALYAYYVEDVQAWNGHRDQLVARALHWLEEAAGVAGNSGVAARLREHVRYATHYGTLWASQSYAAVAMAKQLQQQEYQKGTIAHAVSYALWGLAVLMLFGGGNAAGLSLFVWFGSYVLWLGARRRLRALSDPNGWLLFVGQATRR